MLIDDLKVGDTPITRLFWQYRALLDAAARFPQCDDEDAILERLYFKTADGIADEMMSLPCETPADFAAKLIVDTNNGGLFSSWESGAIWAQARSLVGMPDPKDKKQPPV